MEGSRSQHGESLSQKQEKEIKLFGKRSFKDVEVKDIGLQRYISLKPVVVPHSTGKHEHKRFRKANVNIVERLANNMMRTMEIVPHLLT